MADKTNHTTPPLDSPGDDPPAAKVQRVIVVDEVKDTVALAVEEALKKFSTPASGKYSYLILSLRGVSPHSDRVYAHYNTLLLYISNAIP